MQKQEHMAIYRKDYKVPPFLMETIDLNFTLHPNCTKVYAKSHLKKNEECHEICSNLVLMGEMLVLKKICINGVELDSQAYSVTATELILTEVPDDFFLEIWTEIDPQGNKALSGLYRSSGNYCTQCEAEGFRRITYYLDRPDVLARFRTKITASKTSCPVMLSNGNPVEQGESEDGYHYVVWEDPFPKPSYLFALVAGDLAHISDTYITRSGRTIDLRIYVQEKNRDKCDHAMRSLKKAMQWDEDVYGLEYDLDMFMIFAVDDFNMGAMENKGLNVFNSKYVLASPESATDSDYLGIEGVIAHEYFHNWTGDRVTCRDWFQLSLKEGLTVFRDQEFSADMNSPAVKRIEDVRVLRNSQFREDSGPMAHPVRPESYVEINNFYTVTIYEKGAEVIRMMRLLLGKEDYHRAIDLYFKRFDGMAVTCDDFVQAMEDASGKDLSQFKLWYSQAGTPVVTIKEDWDEKEGLLQLHFSQSCPATPGQNDKRPFHIPISLGLLHMKDNLDGQKILYDETTRLIELRKEEEEYTFGPFSEKPYLSALRGFSAPVKLVLNQTRQELAVLMASDTDLFNRWEATHRFSVLVIQEAMEKLEKKEVVNLDPLFCASLKKILHDSQDAAFTAQALALPAENYIAQTMTCIDPQILGEGYRLVKKLIAKELAEEFLQCYERLSDSGEYSLSAEAMARRSLKNCCLSYLAATTDGIVDSRIIGLCTEQFTKANNMTDRIAALAALSHISCGEREEAFASFYDTWREDPLVLDKWFSLQAVSSLESTFDSVVALTRNPSFSIENPNKVRALIGAFASMNHYRFHRRDGAGYRFLAEYVIRLDDMNPQIAARMVAPFTAYKKYIPQLQHMMHGYLEKILDRPNVSKDVYEIVFKTLHS